MIPHTEEKSELLVPQEGSQKCAEKRVKGRAATALYEGQDGRNNRMIEVEDGGSQLAGAWLRGGQPRARPWVRFPASQQRAEESCAGLNVLVPEC